MAGMKKQNLSQQVADRLLKDIIQERRFAPGEKLPNENALAEHFGVSRATLREAVRFLVAQGSLEIRRGTGTFVSEGIQYRKDFGFQELIRNQAELKELYEARMLIEPRIVRLACRRASDDELRSILKLGAKAEEDVKNGIDAGEADQAFHAAIVHAAHNDFLSQFIPLIFSAIAQFVALSGSSDSLGEIIVEDHRRILEFLRVRDEIGAESAMTVHMRRSVQRLELTLEELPDRL